MVGQQKQWANRSWAPLDSKRLRQTPNQGVIDYPEKHPANPIKDRETRRLTHRGGRASPRTDFF